MQSNNDPFFVGSPLLALRLLQAAVLLLLQTSAAGSLLLSTGLGGGGGPLKHMMDVADVKIFLARV